MVERNKGIKPQASNQTANDTLDAPGIDAHGGKQLARET